MQSSFLFADRPDQIARVRGAFTVAGFTNRGISEVIGSHGLGFIDRGELGPALRRTAGGSPLDTLIRLFVCVIAVPRALAERALAPVPLAEWAEAELIALDGDTVHASITLRPIASGSDKWLVPNDARRRAQHAHDYVAGPGPASLTLAGLTVRDPVARCLDLGTGSGIQALFAHTHAGRVVATDRNPRAVAFTEFAMRLNAITNVEVRAGDLFAPVDGERFGLIVSNPPFVISPAAQYQYRDSGLVGDEICRRIVTTAPAYLEDGGWCQLLANWAHLKGTNWQDRVAEWVADLGCDAWVVQSRVEDAETYASSWLRQEQQPTDAFGEWMDHYDAIGLEAVGFGLITLRRTSRARRWVALEELTQEFALPCGDHIAAAFDRAVWLQEHAADDQALLDARLVVNADMLLHETRFAAEGEWFPDQALLRLEHGLRYAATVDSYGAELVAGCDGVTRVGELVQRFADAIGAEVSDVAPQSLALMRRLIQEGFVTPT